MKEEKSINQKNTDEKKKHNPDGLTAEELAEQILAFASGLSDGGVVDDCTVLVGTVLERG